MLVIPAMVQDTKSRKILVTDIWNVNVNQLKMPQPVYLVTSSCILTVMTVIRIVHMVQPKATPEDAAVQPPTNAGIKPVIILMRLVAPMSVQVTQNHRLQVALMAQPVVMTVALAKLGTNVTQHPAILVRGLAVRQLGLVLMGVHLIPAQQVAAQAYVSLVSLLRAALAAGQADQEVPDQAVLVGQATLAQESVVRLPSLVLTAVHLSLAQQVAVQVFVHHVNQTRVQEKPVLRAAVQKPVPLMTLVVIAQAAEKKQSVIAAVATKMTAVFGPVRMDISVPQMTVTPIRAAAHIMFRVMIQAAAA